MTKDSLAEYEATIKDELFTLPTSMFVRNIAHIKSDAYYGIDSGQPSRVRALSRISLASQWNRRILFSYSIKE